MNYELKKKNTWKRSQHSEVKVDIRTELSIFNVELVIIDHIGTKGTAIDME